MSGDITCMKKSCITEFIECYFFLETETHTCDKCQKGIRVIFLSFQRGLSKVYKMYRKFLNSVQGDFQIFVKSGMF